MLLFLLMALCHVGAQSTTFRGKTGSTLMACTKNAAEFDVIRLQGDACQQLAVLTPCLLFDTSSSSLQSNQAEITVGIVNDVATPTVGAVQAGLNINTLNGGLGFAVGYERKHYVKMRVVGVVTGLYSCEDDHTEHHTAIVNWLMQESAYPPDFLIGSFTTTSQYDLEPCERNNRMVLAQVGPDSLYDGAAALDYKYTFGMHLSSYGYSFGSLKQFSFNGAKTVAIAGREVSAFFKTTCDYAEIFAAEFGMTQVRNRTIYAQEKFTDKEYQKQLATELCNSGADVILGCINTDEAIVWEQTWAEMECRPKAAWITCVAWGCISDRRQFITTGTQWSQQLTYGDEWYESGEDFAAKFTDTYGAYTVKSDTLAIYTSAYVYHKVVQVALRDVSLTDSTLRSLLDFTGSNAHGVSELYEKMRRALETINVPKTIYGPVTMNEKRRNDGRAPVSLQILPNLDANGIDVFSFETFAPGEAASATLKYPAPVSQMCVNNDALQYNTTKCWLCGECKTCEAPLVADDEHMKCVEEKYRGHVSCQVTGCGDFASCDASSTFCVCDAGDFIESPTYKDTHDCMIKTASNEEQRIFWTLQFFVYSIGLYASGICMREFFINKALKPIAMRSYLAIIFPDFIYSLVYFIFQFMNLVTGQETDCVAIGFITYGTVIATVCGPPVVGLFTFSALFHKEPIGNVVLAVCTASSWVLGIIFAVVANGAGLLGSFRGLYCYNKRWDNILSGGLTFIVFFFSVVTTIAIYALMVVKVKKITAESGSKADTHLKVAKRGAMLVGTFFCTWFIWALAALLHWSGAAPPLWMDLLGAMLLSTQPIIDAYILLQTGPVAAERFERSSKAQGPSKKGAGSTRGGSKAGSSKASSKKTKMSKRGSAAGASSAEGTPAVKVDPDTGSTAEPNVTTIEVAAAEKE